MPISNASIRHELLLPVAAVARAALRMPVASSEAQTALEFCSIVSP